MVSHGKLQVPAVPWKEALPCHHSRGVGMAESSSVPFWFSMSPGPAALVAPSPNLAGAPCWDTPPCSQDQLPTCSWVLAELLFNDEPAAALGSPGGRQRPDLEETSRGPCIPPAVGPLSVSGCHGIPHPLTSTPAQMAPRSPFCSGTECQDPGELFPDPLGRHRGDGSLP